jgi:alpha-methylacyl-CoA racemase
MTGWGQDGPMAQAAGHDIDYIALAGALEPIGRQGSAPVPPMNVIGDFGGGGMLLAFGMCAALLAAQRTGKGQVVDAAMVDGSASLTAMLHSHRAMGIWREDRGTNILDTGAHFYEVYETSDGGFMAVGAIEPQFYAELLDRLGMDDVDASLQMDRDTWPDMKRRFKHEFLTHTRREWERIFAGADACVAPVLSPGEAPSHPHNQRRATFAEIDGVVQPAPSPRFKGTPGSIRCAPPNPGQYGDQALVDWGFNVEDIAGFRDLGAIR